MTTEALATEDKEELEFKDTKVPFLKVATGGRGPVDPEDPAWLKRYDVGTQFCSKQKGAYLCQQFYLTGISPQGKVYNLFGKGIGEIDVDPVGFSQANQLVEILQTAEEAQYLLKKMQQEKETNKETTDGGSEGSV